MSIMIDEAMKRLTISAKNASKRRHRVFVRFPGEEIEIILSEYLLWGKAENISHRAAAVYVMALRVLFPETFAGHLRHVSEALFAFGERLLISLLLGNILLDR